MRRNLSALANTEYDLVIVGGGIFGVCAAWDAALRGLSVTIIEKGDFAHATSANHFKMVHGGIRYLQHADIHRVRESSRERTALLRIAPHLVQPLPIVIPTYGHGIKGRGFLRAGLLLYDILTLDRNRGVQADRRIPRGRFISRHEVLELFSGIKEKSLTGGAVFCDGQIYNPPRLAISFLKSAVNRGADAANYVEATGFLQKGDRVSGVKARDVLTGNQLEIRGKVVLNTAGPWAHRLLRRGLGLRLNSSPTFSRDLAFVVSRCPTMRYAIAFSTKTKDADSVLDRGGRHLFAVPWRDYTLIGVWHVVSNEAPEKIGVTEKELQKFIDEVNEAYSGLALALDDISIINTGLTLFGEENRQGRDNMSFGKRSQLIDHNREHQLEGLVTLIGVRATTARGMAEKAINIIVNKLGKRTPRSQTEVTPIYGGHIGFFEDFLRDAIGNGPPAINSRKMRALVHNYGSQYHQVLKYVKENPTWIEGVGESTVLKAEVIHAVREEMAQKLADVVFRRTDLATGGHPGDEALETCAHLMSSEMGWNENGLYKEVEEVKRTFPFNNRDTTMRE